MKATGIVRRVDDLGRVVIPKELRRMLHISEGDQVEIYTENDGVIVKKYSPLADCEKNLTVVAEAVAETTGYGVVITDGEYVRAAAPTSKAGCIGKEINNRIAKTAEERQIYRYRAGGARVPLLQNGAEGYVGVSVPIVSAGDLFGQLIVLLPDSGAVPDDMTVRAAKTGGAVIVKLLRR